MLPPRGARMAAVQPQERRQQQRHLQGCCLLWGRCLRQRWLPQACRCCAGRPRPCPASAASPAAVRRRARQQQPGGQRRQRPTCSTSRSGGEHGAGFVCGWEVTFVRILCVPVWGAGMHWPPAFAAPSESPPAHVLLSGVALFVPLHLLHTPAGMATVPPSGTTVPPRCPSTCWRPLMLPWPAWATQHSSCASSCWPGGRAAASPPAACHACRGRCSAADGAAHLLLCRKQSYSNPNFPLLHL